MRCATLLAILLLAACDSPSESSSSDIASIRVEPPLLAAMRGETGSLTATALDAQGRALPNISFEWSSTSPGIAVSDGQVSAVSAGAAVVTASADDVTGSAHVRVSECPDATLPFRIVVRAAECDRRAGMLVGDTLRLITYLTGDVEADGVTWSSSSAATASVDAQGIVSAQSEGAVTIRAARGAARDSVEIVIDTTGTILFVPDSVTLTPDESAVLVLRPLVAGHIAPSTHFSTLLMSDSSVIRDTYANANRKEAFLLVTGAAEGETTLTYTYRNMTGSATVRVRR